LNGSRASHQNSPLSKKGQAEVKDQEKNITTLDWMTWISDPDISSQHFMRVHKLPILFLDQSIMDYKINSVWDYKIVPTSM
jgi:hypothetical protein